MASQVMLECPACGYTAPYLQPLPACPQCGRDWLEARYPYTEWRDKVLGTLYSRPYSMWRYRELLPLRVESNIVTMGEGGTPLLHADNLSLMMGRPHLYIKDERQ